MEFFTNFMFRYGILAVFFVITIEYACFPISSEIVLPFAGAVASISQVSFFTVILVSVVGGMIGTSFCFFIGKVGGKALIKRIISKYPKTQSSLNSSMERFKHYGKYAVCFGRLIPLVRTYIAFIAGAYGLSYPSFLLFSSLGITTWNTLLIGLGYYLRENWQLVAEAYERYKSYVLPIFLILIIFLIVRARRK